ncbi:MAG: M42 family peptidase [Anaerolineales bacterium]|nr:MAG: M42 family peptidase [Anaerolineales bacterium]
MTSTGEWLQELTAIPALSGYEDRMVARMREAFLQYTHQVEVDRLGNVVATIEGQSAEPCLMIFAHMDELGLVVRKIEPDGFLRFERVGGVPEKSLMAARIEVHTESGERIPGVVGMTSHHVTPPEKKFVVPSRLEMYIDIGCSSREEVEALGVQVGDGMTYMPNYTELKNGRVVSKTLDNRIGCVLLIKTLEALAAKKPRGKVLIVASVQEEFNVRGVWPVFQANKPDAAICLDVTIATDTPEIRHLGEVEIGGGPAIGLYEFHGRGTLGGLIPHPKLRKFISSIADQEKIPLQREVLIGIITDAAFSQLLGEKGVAMASLAVPIRYTHAPTELCDLEDIEATSALLSAVALAFDQGVDLSRG